MTLKRLYKWNESFIFKPTSDEDLEIILKSSLLTKGNYVPFKLMLI